MLVRIEAERVLEVFERELEETLLRLNDLNAGVSRVLASGLLDSKLDVRALRRIETQVECGKRQIRLARSEAGSLLAQR